MEHYHYIVGGYENEEEDGRLADFSTIDVFANGEDEALEKAAKLLTKKYYRVASIVTHDETICMQR